MWNSGPSRRMLYIPKAINPAANPKPQAVIIFLRLYFGRNTDNEGSRPRAKTAGDLVSQAPPRAKPDSMAKSNRRRLTAMKNRQKAHTTNIVIKLSERANRSKKTAYGRTAQSIEATRAVRKFLNISQAAAPTPATVPIPVKPDTILPAKRGSENILRKGITSHINSGCLPSDRGKKRIVDSAFII